MNINFFQYDMFFYFVIKIFMIDTEFKIVHNKMNTINKFEKYEIVRIFIKKSRSFLSKLYASVHYFST